MTVPRRSHILRLLKIFGWTVCFLALALWAVSARWDIVAWKGGWEISLARGRFYAYSWPKIHNSRPMFGRPRIQPSWQYHSRAVVDCTLSDRLGLNPRIRFEWSPSRRVFAAPFWMPFLGAATVTLGVHRLDRRTLKPGVCPCGYDLRGNMSGRCPECGRPVLLPATEEVGAEVEASNEAGLSTTASRP